MPQAGCLIRRAYQQALLVRQNVPYIRQLVTPLWQRLPLKALELVAHWRRVVHYY
ncbi:hypothetical protein [Reticulibacter mediterranei]|uniref:hypothetical protein n=1 Tax=Reticulibacter mediterranei TaxID=2778369 RepID=UPI001C68DD8C|nr:hypothetical protein [Reticulibacter mediterranei]